MADIIKYIKDAEEDDDDIIDLWDGMLYNAQNFGLLDNEKLQKLEDELDDNMKKLFAGTTGFFLENLQKLGYPVDIMENILGDEKTVLKTFGIGAVMSYLYLVNSLNDYKKIDEKDPNIKKVITDLHKLFLKIIAYEKKERKNKIKKMKKKITKQQKDENKRAKKVAKAELKKQAKRTKNTFCKNTIEFITQEDIEDIPTEDLTFIKLDKLIYCLDKDSFKNIIKYAKDQKVRGACKKVEDGQPLNCKWFYPINIGRNIYISEKNYNNIKKNHIDKRMFSLKNMRVVDFTTGLHIISEKTGKDNVYDLVPDNYIEEIKKKTPKPQKKTPKPKKKTTKPKKKLTIAELKKECKKKGIKGYSKLKKAELEKKCL